MLPPLSIVISFGPWLQEAKCGQLWHNSGYSERYLFHITGNGLVIVSVSFYDV